MRMIAAGMLSGSVCLSAAPAFAQTVTVDGPAAVLHVAAPAEDGAQTQEMELQSFELFGLGLLTGGADGDYGAGTAGAVSAFQTAHGLEATGSADVYTMMLITAIHDGLEESVTAAAGGYDTPEEKFPQIAANTDADLSIYMDNLWRFHFDSFEDAGAIDPGVELGTFEVLVPEIDRIRGTASLKVQVSKDEATGMYTAVPAIVTETAGAYRPYMQGAYLTGGTNVKLDGGSSTGSIDGATLMETGCIPLTEEALSLLKEGGVTGIRLIGKNSEYDLSLNIDADRLAAAMQAF